MSEQRPLIDRLRDCAGAWADFDYDADAAVCYEAADRIKELEAKVTSLNSCVQVRRKEVVRLKAKLDAVTEELSLAERYIPSFDRKMYQQSKKAIGEQELASEPE